MSARFRCRCVVCAALRADARLAASLRERFLAMRACPRCGRPPSVRPTVSHGECAHCRIEWDVELPLDEDMAAAINIHTPGTPPKGALAVFFTETAAHSAERTVT